MASFQSIFSRLLRLFFATFFTAALAASARTGFFHRYFGAAEKSMKKFYLHLEQIACNPKNYPPPYRKRNRIDWQDVAWNCLGTAERMEQLGALVTKAQALA
jgi:hypothetical protein